MDGKEKLRRFAHFFARHNLQAHHYDNCRVVYSQAHAYGFAFEFLLRGYSGEQIEGAYYHAMIALHQYAVDNEYRAVVPSGLITGARRRLERVKPANQLYDPKGILVNRGKKMRFAAKPPRGNN